jgi:hypothetical protein
MNDVHVLPRFTGRAVHEDLVSYFQYELEHGLYNAHHLRANPSPNAKSRKPK